MRGALLFSLVFVCIAARAASPAAYTFTDAACVNGKAFGTPGQCKQLAGAPTLAGAATPVFVTALAGGVPTALSTSVNTTVPLTFALSCINPASNAGKQAKYAGVALPLCAPNGGAPALWSNSVGMLFKKNAPSVTVNPSFSYPDVGKVQLFLRDGANQVVAAVPFVVKPASLEITAVTRIAGGATILNPQPINGAGLGFAKVGEAFTIKVGAKTTTGAIAPNFGSEGVRVALGSQRGGNATAKAAMVVLPALSGGFTTVVGGEFSGDAFAVDEPGILAITPRLDYNNNDDYLGAGAAGSNLTTRVGRFYPDHFDTSVALVLPCLANMNCPAGVLGAAYSGQPFAVTVKPKHASGADLKNYNRSLARPITLSAFSQAGGATPNPSAGALSGNVIAATSMLPNLSISAQVTYALPQPFANSAPRALNWTAPTAIFLRASADENVAAGTTTISSLRGAASVEGATMVISGRLALGNPYGSELLRMPIRTEAQYWSASGRWETSASDSVSIVQSGGIVFANCLKNVSCTLLRVTPNALVPLQSGVATFWLRAPGANMVGSAEFQMNNPPWLPSTIGRAVFGIHTSPFIYLREGY